MLDEYFYELYPTIYCKKTKNIQIQYSQIGFPIGTFEKPYRKKKCAVFKTSLGESERNYSDYKFFGIDKLNRGAVLKVHVPILNFIHIHHFL